MTPWAANPLVTSAMEQIQQALEQNRLVQFHYQDRYKAASLRIVEPHQLVLKESNWYLRAWCRERDDFRTFKLDRMRDLQLLSETFEPREFQTTLEDFKNWHSDRAITIELIIDESVRERALDYCREEYFTDQEDGTIVVRMPFVESAMGYSVLLGLGPGCEVVGPPHVRAEFIRWLERMRALYG